MPLQGSKQYRAIAAQAHAAETRPGRRNSLASYSVAGSPHLTAQRQAIRAAFGTAAQLAEPTGETPLQGDPDVEARIEQPQGTQGGEASPGANESRRACHDGAVTQRIAIQLLSITKAMAGKVSISGQDRLEVPIEITRDDSTTATITLNTSYKKHMKEAYTGGIEITAQPADTNTIATLGESDFSKAFEDFAFLFAKKLKNSDPAAFSPSAPANELTTSRGISFHSDNANLGAAVHCFPTVTAGNAVVLSRAEFTDLKLLTNIAYHTSANLNNGAITQANQALVRYGNSASIGALFSVQEISTLQKLVNTKITASQENEQRLRGVKREAGILGGKVNRGEVKPADVIIGGKPVKIE